MGDSSIYLAIEILSSNSQPLTLITNKAISHSCDVVTDRSGKFILTIHLTILRAHLRRIIRIIVEKWHQQCDSTPVGFVDLRVIIQVSVKVFPKFQIMLLLWWAIGNQRHTISSHLRHI